MMPCVPEILLNGGVVDNARGGYFGACSRLGPAMSDVIVSYHQIAEPELDPWGMRVSAARFSEHMRALRQVADPVPLIDLLATPPGSQPRVAVTFDDGYFDNLSVALPILRRFDVPATVFVATGYIGKSHFWWDVLEDVLLTPGTIEGTFWPADGCVSLPQPPPSIVPSTVQV